MNLTLKQLCLYNRTQSINLVCFILEMPSKILQFYHSECNKSMKKWLSCIKKAQKMQHEEVHNIKFLEHILLVGNQNDHQFK